MCRYFLHAFVASASDTAFQARMCIFRGTLASQTLRHIGCWPSGEALDALIPMYVRPVASRYALFIVNLPLFSGNQARKSWPLLGDVRIFTISRTSISQKYCRKRCTFQAPDSSRKSATQLYLHVPFGVMGLKSCPLGIHASLQVLIKDPSPTLQISPFLSSSKPCVMPLHTADDDVGNTVCNKFPLG